MFLIFRLREEKNLSLRWSPNGRHRFYPKIVLCLLKTIQSSLELLVLALKISGSIVQINFGRLFLTISFLQLLFLLLKFYFFKIYINVVIIQLDC